MVCTSGNGRTGDTFCFSGGSGGPNEDDCAVIADAILYDSQNVGAIFNATAPGTATDKVTMQYKSCLTYFLNQDTNNTLEYCRSDWVSGPQFLLALRQRVLNVHTVFPCHLARL